jgi:hypothetical protein
MTSALIPRTCDRGADPGPPVQPGAGPVPADVGEPARRREGVVSDPDFRIPKGEAGGAAPEARGSDSLAAHES